MNDHPITLRASQFSLHARPAQPRQNTSPSSLCKSSVLLKGLAEHEQLGLVVDREHTSTGNATKDVGTGTLEQRPSTLSGDDLTSGIEGGFVFDGLLNMISII